MSNKNVLTSTEVLQRSIAYSAVDVKPIIKYLDMPTDALKFTKSSTLSDAEKIAAYLRKMGSNDIATLLRGGDGVSYKEVVYDVGVKLKVPDVKESNDAETNEALIINKLFADALDQMSVEEKRALFGSMGLSSSDIPYGSAGTIILQLLLKNFGGFTVYRTSVIVANLVARALLGSGLSFATNAALTRTIGAFLGPIGWIASGAWLAIDLAGPAYRKTIPSVVHVAMLRQMVRNRINIGVVGDGSVGKDSMFKSVFGLDTGNVSPIAGSTENVEEWELGNSGAVKLINFPGFNDINPSVNAIVEDQLNHVDVFIMVVDLSRGVSGTDDSILKKLKRFNRPILVCLNKIDWVREKDKESLLHTARSRLTGADMIIETAFDPDERLCSTGPVGVDQVFEWVETILIKEGKETSHLKQG